MNFLSTFISDDKICFLKSNKINFIKLPEFELLFYLENDNFKFITLFQNKIFVVPNDKNNSIILIYEINSDNLPHSYQCFDTILNLKSNNSFLFIIHSKKINLYTNSPFKIVHSYEIDFNITNFTCSSNFFAWTIESSPGLAYLVSISDLKTIFPIQCHKSLIKFISLSPISLLFCTASEKGTIIRSFSTQNHQQISQFRRGITRTEILSLNITSDYIIAITNSTIHLFFEEDRHITYPTEGITISSIIISNFLYQLYSNNEIYIYLINKNIIFQKKIKLIEL